MTKATSPLHPKFANLNRRRLLGGAAAAAAGVAAPAAASASTAPVFAPSPLGLEFQAAVAEYLAWCPRQPDSGCPEAMPDTPKGWAAFNAGHDAAWARRCDLSACIWRQPLSPANLVDRALVAQAWRQDETDLAVYLPGASEPAEASGADEHGPSNALIAAVLQLAGLSLDPPAGGLA